MLVGGRYLLCEPVGEGGMGRVWRGQDQLLGRVVAVKEVLLPPQSPQACAELVARTLREARATARLDHPGVVTVFDVVEHDDAPWIVMRFIGGPSLGAEIARLGRLPWQQVAGIGGQVADALADAHAAGIVHRDLKPDNILLSGRQAIVTDFGIARIIDATTKLTGTGIRVGTVNYMAPEQLEGSDVGPPADLWALGATLYAATEGRPPFDGSTLAAIMAAILTRAPAPPQHAGALRGLIGALLAKNPADRPGTQAVISALADAVASPTLESRESAAVMPVAVQDAAEIPGQHPVTATAGQSPDTTSTLLPGDQVQQLADGARPSGAELIPDAAPDGTGGLALARPDGPTGAAIIPAATGEARSGGGVEHGGGVTASEDPGPAGYSADDVRGQRARRSRHLRIAVALAGVTLVTTATIAAVLGSSHHGPAGISATLTPSRSAATLTPSRSAATLTPSRSAATIRPSRIATLTDPGEHGGSVQSVAFSSDGTRLATGDVNSGVFLWDVTARHLIATLRRPSSPGATDYGVLSVAFSPSGTTLAAAVGNGSTYLWDLATKSPVATLNLTNSVGFSLGFSPGGSLLAVGDTKGVTHLWDLATRSVIATVTDPGGKNGVSSVSFSPDGKTLATADGNGSTYLWDVATSSLIVSLTDPHSEITNIAFSPDGKLLVIVSGAVSSKYPGTVPVRVSLWDLATRTRIVTLSDPASLGVSSVAFSPDGKLLATGDGNGSTYLWNLAI
jgi:hypothetical protein